ncbi:MAG: hypothetical protein OXB84_08715, partial [Halobacteriovoraceae bacterium]|nr:hypothetical protein [Halobacteriovoraceae bacterium]
LYTVVLSIGWPLVYGSYLDEIDKQNSIKINLSALKNAKKTITVHWQTKTPKNRLHRRNRPKTAKRISKKILRPKAIPKKINIPVTVFVNSRKIKLKEITPLSIKKDNSFKISNERLVEHYGFKVEESGMDLVAHFRKHKINEKLIALSNKEKKRKNQKARSNTPKLALSNKATEEQIKPLNIIQQVKKVLDKKIETLKTDKLNYSMASTNLLTTHKKTSRESEYPKTGPPLNASLSPPSSISQINKDILSPTVRQAINREYDKFKMNTNNKDLQTRVSTQMNIPVNIQSPRIFEETKETNNKKEKSVKEEDDLVVFTYPDKPNNQKTVDNSSQIDLDKMFNPLPTPPYNKFFQGNGQKNNTKTKTSTVAVNAAQQGPLPVIQMSPEVVKTGPTENNSKGLLATTTDNKNKNQDFIEIDGRLTAYQAGKSENALLYNLMFSPDYDLNASIYDHGNGEINITEKLNGSMSILSGVLSSPEMIKTRINWMLTSEDQNMHVPLFTESNFYELLEQNDLNDQGAHLLIKLNDAVEKTDLDSEYDGKLYLNKNFDQSSDDALFVLYIGVNPGNRLIKYHTFNDKISEKVVFLGEGEVFYDDANFWGPGLQRIALFEKKLMGNNQSELVIEGEQITYFNKEIKASIAGTNLYEYLRPQLPTGMRQYLRLSHLDGTIFLGNWQKEKLEVPSASFIDEIYRTFDIENLLGRCFIQLNFSKKIMSVKSQGISAKGPIYLQTSVLEKDGTITNEITGNADKIFLLGDEPGMVNIKIIYGDDSMDVLQTYCSNDSYLVEQL